MNTIELFQSKEYDIFKRLKRVMDAYQRLLNPQFENLAGAKEALNELRAAAKDLEMILRAALLDWEVPPSLVRNVNAWTQDSLDSKVLNAQHHNMRFLHAQTTEQKIKEVTAMYYIVVDLVAISEFIRPENYYRELIL